MFKTSRGDPFTGKITIHNVTMNPSVFGYYISLKCEGKRVELREVNKCTGIDIEGKELVDVKKCDFTKLGVHEDASDFWDSVRLRAHNVIFKENKFQDGPYCSAGVEIVAIDNFDIEGNSRDDFNLSLYYSKHHTFRNKTFRNVHLLGLKDLWYFYVSDGKNSKVVFESCKLTGHLFKNRAENAELNNCTVSGKINFACLGGGNLKIDNLTQIGSAGGVECNFVNNDYDGSVVLKNCSFKSVSKFSSGGNFDISNCQFEIGGNVLGTYTWFSGEDVKITDSTFERKYEYTVHTKSRVLLSVYDLTLKRTTFKNVGSMFQTSISADRYSFNDVKSKVNIEDCSFDNAGSIYAKYDEFSVKNSYMNRVELDIWANNKNTSSSKTLFENCDFHRFCVICVGNNYEGIHYGPVAVRFKYDISQLPANLHSAISGTPTWQKVANVLKARISGSTDRVGYFLNLGNATPSNSHPSKFYGSYY